MERKESPGNWPVGTPIGGQFPPENEFGCIRSEPMKNDIRSYCYGFGRGTREERIIRINQALYDGGYIKERDDSLHGFDSIEDAEKFIRIITSRHNVKLAWVKHKELVENHVDIVKNYLQRDEFDFVINGYNSNDGTERNALELTSELSWDRETVRQTLMCCLTADSFVSSGKNNSRYGWNKGTVVMVFSPRMETKQFQWDEETGEEVIRRKVIDLYVKITVNPHPGRNKDGTPQSEVQILSFKEAGVTDKDSPNLGKMHPKVCLYTGEVHRSRWEWMLPEFRNHQNRPFLS